MTKFETAILKRLDIFLKLFSNYLVIKTIESKVVKTLTDKEIETITPIATRIITATGQDRDFRITNFSDTETTDPTATRYSFDKRILMDYATSLNYQFTIEAR